MTPATLSGRRPPATRLRIQSLTSLRFFAAFAVMLSHIRFTLPGLAGATGFDVLFFGVEFFFVLSGFVLTLRYAGGVRPLAEYYPRRLARVFPLHIATFLAWFLVFGVSWDAPLVAMAPIAGANLLLIHTFMPGWHYTMSVNPVSWSLSAEAFFYVVFPFIVAVPRALTTALAILTFTLIWLATGMDIGDRFPAFFELMPPIRLFEFCLGILAGHGFLALRRHCLPVRLGTVFELAAIGAVIGSVWATRMVPDELGHPLAAPAFALAILVMAREEGWLSRAIAGSPLLVRLGAASFSLYMWHHMAMTLVGRTAFASDYPALTAILLLPALAALSILSWRWIEEPLARLFTARLTTV
ncbi:MAG TPA: acyltransferase [Stellaceae bacterium]|nr:acyltransferase [Stellaceae bacterium]